MNNESALRFDTGKPQFHHFHPEWLAATVPGIVSDPMFLWFYYRIPLPMEGVRHKDAASVLEIGAAKYGSGNFWKGMLYSRVFNSYIRHSVPGLYYNLDIDDETGLRHERHAQCNLMFAQTYQLLGYDGGEFDDRPAKGFFSKKKKEEGRSQILDALTADAQNLKLDY